MKEPTKEPKVRVDFRTGSLVSRDQTQYVDARSYPICNCGYGFFDFLGTTHPRSIYTQILTTSSFFQKERTTPGTLVWSLDQTKLKEINVTISNIEDNPE